MASVCKIIYKIITFVQAVFHCKQNVKKKKSFIQSQFT